jgi:NAD(P)-dependent dehydrogenase (short-subunit alcohol dehydrogenase family)
VFDTANAGIRDRVFLITGGSKGIGAECALEIAKLGGKVAIASRDNAAGRETADIIRRSAATPDDVLALQANVASIPQIQDMVDATVGRFGRIDVLINSAGLAIRAPAKNITENQWDTVIDVNLKGTFFAAQAFARAVPEGEHGNIINISSQYGHVGSPTRAAYCASKGGVELMTKALAVEWAPKIRVNTVCPTFTETDLVRSILEQPGTGPALLERIPMHRFGQVQDVTGAVLYLASDYSGMVTGTAIMVDGGWTAA